MFYNTINLNGSELIGATDKTESQKQQILRFFLEHPGKAFTPVHVHNNMGFLLTSVRRSLSDLTKDGHLTKTEEQRREIFGAVNFKWTLNVERYPQKGQLDMFNC